MPDQIAETDVLIIGGGGAGFRAAIGAREKGARTMLLSKGPIGRSGATPMAGADLTLDGKSLKEQGFNGDPNDSFEKVSNDILSQGFYLNNQKLVDQYIEAAPQALKELVEWGIPVRASEERAIFTSGIAMMDALVKKAKASGVELVEDIMALDLTTDDGAVTGAVGLDIKTGQLIQFKAKAVVMATGGWHKAFWPNTGMRDLSGEGLAMAHRAGADIGNMEFITFCCNVFYDPPIWRGSIAPYVLGLMAGHKLTNSKGEEFLNQYDSETVRMASSMEWNKSFISYASAREIRQGNAGPNGGIFFSRGDIPWESYGQVCAMMFPKWKYKAIDFTEWGRKLEADEPVEVGPAVEYFDGGIVVDENFESSLAGLFACGECALGAFGSNRVFAATTEMLVQGKDAGRNAGTFAGDNAERETDSDAVKFIMDKALKPLAHKGSLAPAALRREVQLKAHSHLGPIRNQNELESFLEYLKNVREQEIPNLNINSKNPVYNKEWLDALELGNMVHLLEASANSALFRKESRGVHFREDHPFTDNDNWLLESIIRAGSMRVGTRPVTVTNTTLPTGILPYLDMLKKLMDAHSDIGGHH